MKRSIGIALAGFVGLCVVAISPAAAETWYAQRVTQGDAGMGVEHLWSSGASLRAEVVVSGHPVVTVVHGNRYWVLDRLSGEGISIERHPNAIRADNPAVRPFGDEADRLQRQGGEFIRDEPLGENVSCRLFKLTDDRGRQEVCIRSDDTALPVFVKSWNRTSRREAVISYANWGKGLEIENSFFSIAADAKVKSYTYAAYAKASQEGNVGPAPVLFPQLLHGEREE
jgi:hypothetical protein